MLTCRNCGVQLRIHMDNCIYTSLKSLPSTGAYVSLFTVILVELLGLQSISSALGFVSVFCGTAALSGPPLAGRLFNVQIKRLVTVVFI